MLNKEVLTQRQPAGFNFGSEKKNSCVNSQKNSQYFHHHLRKSFLEVTSKSRDNHKRKSLLNLTIHRPVLAKVRGKENKCNMNFTKQIVDENPNDPRVKEIEAIYQLKRNRFRIPNNYLVRVETEDPLRNDDDYPLPFDF